MIIETSEQFKFRYVKGTCRFVYHAHAYLSVCVFCVSVCETVNAANVCQFNF